MTSLDLRMAADAFVAIACTEAIIKPIAVRLVRLVLMVIDRYAGVVPDWLYRPKV